MSSAYLAKYSSYSSTDTVLKNTLLLVALSMIPTAVAAWLVSLVPMTYYAEHPWLTIGLFVGNFLLSLGLMFWAVSARNNALGVFAMLLFAFSMGAGLGPMIGQTLAIKDGSMLIASAAGITGLALLIVTTYVWITKKDFSFLGSFLFAGLIAVIGMSVVGLFFNSSTYQIVVSCIAVLVFIGYLLFDISRVVNGGEKNYILAAISIYLDLVNIFIHVLSILLNSRK